MIQLTLFNLDKPKIAQMKITTNTDTRERHNIIAQQMNMALLLSVMYHEGTTQYNTYDKNGNKI